MIKLGKLTDYAVVVMGEMARRPAQTHNVGCLAERTGVPAPTVAKILKALAQGALVTSQRGAMGGYALSRAASDISMADIITALEGPISLTACVERTDSGCGVERLCPMRSNWDRVSRAIRGALEQVTLADMSFGLPDAALEPAFPDVRLAGPQSPKEI